MMLKPSEGDGKRLWDRLMQSPEGATDAEAVSVSSLSADGSVADIDDATAAYIEATRPSFEHLRQVEAQLAGLLVLALASGQSIAGHPMLELVAEAVKEAEDGLPSIKVPAPARHHHVHLLLAMQQVALSLAAARRCLLRDDDRMIDAALVPLRSAHQHLLWATSALPGLEIVALSQACCAQHAAGVRPGQA
jgi:hypothetical protein